MIFSRALALAALPLLAVATHGLHKARTGASPCTTGPVQCCDSVSKASDPSASKVLGLLGVVVKDVNVLVGLSCTPITVIGVGGSKPCSAHSVCCEDNSHGGLVSVGCVPVSV